MRERPSRRTKERGSFDDISFGVPAFEEPRAPARTYGGAAASPYGGNQNGFSVAPRKPSPAAATRFSVSAEVKWFSAEKGFGFAAAEGGTDVFVHGSVVRASGRDSLEAGDRIVVDIAPSERGEKAVTIHSVEPGQPSSGSSPALRAVIRDAAPAPVGSVLGTLKWYNATKGFGFVAPDGGGPDVFLHATALERSGVPAESLRDGTRISAEVVSGRQGKTEIGSFRLA